MDPSGSLGGEGNLVIQGISLCAKGAKRANDGQRKLDFWCDKSVTVQSKNIVTICNA